MIMIAGFCSFRPVSSNRIRCVSRRLQRQPVSRWVHIHPWLPPPQPRPGPVYVTSDQLINSMSFVLNFLYQQLISERPVWRETPKWWPHVWVHMKFRCGSSHQHSSKQQSDDEARYSFYSLLMSRSDRISVEPDEAERDTRGMKWKRTVTLM